MACFPLIIGGGGGGVAAVCMSVCVSVPNSINTARSVLLLEWENSLPLGRAHQFIIQHRHTLLKIK